jgi:hypothetical protein
MLQSSLKVGGEEERRKKNKHYDNNRFLQKLVCKNLIRKDNINHIT